MITADEIAALLQEIKGLPHVDVDGDFHSYGADSLDLLRLADLVESRTGLTCGIEELAVARTPTELAELINQIVK